MSCFGPDPVQLAQQLGGLENGSGCYWVFLGAHPNKLRWFRLTGKVPCTRGTLKYQASGGARTFASSCVYNRHQGAGHQFLA
ncbi:hypothetical protein GGTG_00409 [Gaeumannomyces tritici R3-111a-1]|uniref:Uncharacterized protein n=1 Tax=Gaeumannomyces tritici (strain R3-111a-1) TaxID=644352 RepID=J3NGM0_GAET3|nr:hypothetical protein GGTG_00409 [Gaeumannomyces tritici R3-111a-1]EJT80410.1 hypothetical protein GGTG_00409 [Gaeumannomyces tritici R3-111a-1]